MPLGDVEQGIIYPPETFSKLMPDLNHVPSRTEVVLNIHIIHMVVKDNIYVINWNKQLKTSLLWESVCKRCALEHYHMANQTITRNQAPLLWVLALSVSIVVCDSHYNLMKDVMYTQMAMRTMNLAFLCSWQWLTHVSCLCDCRHHFWSDCMCVYMWKVKLMLSGQKQKPPREGQSPKKTSVVPKCPLFRGSTVKVNRLCPPLPGPLFLILCVLRLHNWNCVAAVV